jgi:oligopeptide transport system substrate-binding protein
VAVAVAVAALALAIVLPTAARADRVVRLAISEDPPQLDSTRATDTVSSFILGHTQEGLTSYGQHGEIVPGVAESWEIRENGATFRLRKEARWSDGKPVTANDFVFAWRNVVDPATASEYAFILYTVKNGEAINAGKLPPSALGVRAVDDHTLEVEFERPCPYFLGLTAFKTFDPIREDFYRSRKGRYGATPDDLLSNGPFKLTHWDHEASLVLEKNPLYWDAASIQLDRIEIPYITNDSNARLNLFRDGSVDFLEAIGRDESRRSQVERLPMRSFAEGSLGYLSFNHRPNHATANIHLRRAIQLVYDAREYISAVVGIPGTRPPPGLVPSWVPGVEQTFRKEHPFTAPRPNLEEAQRELAIAKKELGGKIPPLNWLTFDGPGAKRQAEYFQYVLGNRLGIEIVIDKQVFKQVLAKQTAGDYDIAVAGWVADYGDPMTFIDLFTSWNANNYGRYTSPRYDALVRSAQSEADPRKRMEDMAAAERIALEDLAVLPISEGALVYLQSRRVDGIVRHQIGPDPDLTHARVVDQESSRAWSATR